MSASSGEPFLPEQVRIVPANEVAWDTIDSVFGTADYASRCRCQRLKVHGWIWRDSTLEQRLAMQLEQTGCGDPSAERTSGLIAFVDDEPAGWVAVEPRIEFPNLRRTVIPWKGRDEDRYDAGVWAVTCLIVRKGFRGRGLTYLMAAATIDHARHRGASALEAYPMVTEPGKEVTWGELNVGARQVFADAGFHQVSHPTKRRVVMRIDFG